MVSNVVEMTLEGAAWAMQLAVGIKSGDFSIYPMFGARTADSKLTLNTETMLPTHPVARSTAQQRSPDSTSVSLRQPRAHDTTSTAL